MIREYIEAIRRDRIALFMLFGGVALVSCLFLGVCAYIVADYSGRAQQAIPQPAPVEFTPTDTPLPQPTPGPTATLLILEFSGQDDDVIFFDSPAEGLALFDTGHMGEGNFIVEVQQGDGAYVDLAANEVGEFRGQKTVYLRQGQYVINVKADGPWHVVIAPPQLR